MIFVTKKMKFAFSGIAVLGFYVLSLVLTPWFHLHPGEYHPGSRDNGYHSHAELFATHTSEHSADDNQEDATPQHVGETITPFEDMVGIVQVNPGDIINPATFPPVLVLSVQASVENCSNQVSWQDAFTLLPLQPQQDYYVLTATNLSPPQA